MTRLQSSNLSLNRILTDLRRRGSKKDREGMARYGIRPVKVFGVSVTELRRIAKTLDGDPKLVQALWASGWHEARMLASLIEDPQRLTSARMDRWCRDFDNWALCDTVTCHLFARSDLAWKKVKQWSRSDKEYVKRAAFSLLAGLAVHAKSASDRQFTAVFVDIRRASRDERGLVKKSVNWALRQIGKRNSTLHPIALALARELAERSDAPSRWVGKDAVRELTSAAVLARLKRRLLR